MKYEGRGGERGRGGGGGRGGLKLTSPHKKLPSKSPALLGTRQVQLSALMFFDVENNDKDSKFKVGNDVKDCNPNWSEDIVKKLRPLCHGKR